MVSHRRELGLVNSVVVVLSHYFLLTPLTSSFYWTHKLRHIFSTASYPSWCAHARHHLRNHQPNRRTVSHSIHFYYAFFLLYSLGGYNFGWTSVNVIDTSKFPHVLILSWLRIKKGDSPTPTYKAMLAVKVQLPLTFFEWSLSHLLLYTYAIYNHPQNFCLIEKVIQSVGNLGLFLS